MDLLKFTINVRKFHRQLQCILQLVCDDRALLFIVDLHFPLRRKEHPKCERSVRLVYPPFFCMLRASSNPAEKNLMYQVCRFKQLCLRNHSELDMSMLTFFVTMTDIITSPNTELSLESPCINMRCGQNFECFTVKLCGTYAKYKHCCANESYALKTKITVNYTAWFKKMDSISYVYISWTIHGMWTIYITFEREGPKFSNTTARALA